MIGTHPMVDLAPLDYRYALDAAMSLLNDTSGPLVQCNIPALEGEILQRIPTPQHLPTISSSTSFSEQTPALAPAAALWIEPMRDTWQDELRTLAHALTNTMTYEASLVIIASQPLARMVPERKSWPGNPLGIAPLGIATLRRALKQHGGTVEATYGIHSLFAIGLSMVSHYIDRYRPELGDRLHFASRLRYAVRGPFAPLATVALIVVRQYHVSTTHPHQIVSVGRGMN